VVASAVGGLVETVLNGETGLLVPSEDKEALAVALRQLCLDANLRRKMGDSGRALVEQRYTLSVMVDKISNAYRSLAS
jgi:glycosyltransferase involved in cell wall biosynthesis